MTGTTGLEPATSDVTGLGPNLREVPISFDFSWLCASRGSHFLAATVDATVRVNRFMPDLAYNGVRARKASRTAQVDLADGLARSASGFPACGSAETRLLRCTSPDRADA